MGRNSGDSGVEHQTKHKAQQEQAAERIREANRHARSASDQRSRLPEAQGSRDRSTADHLANRIARGDTAAHTAERREQLIKAQDKVVQLGLSGKYRQEDVGGKIRTHCSEAVREVLKRMNVSIKGLTGQANDMFRFLDHEAGKPHGSWIRVEKDKVQRLANEGIPVVAARKALVSGHHGHVAIVRPGHEPTEKGAPFLTNVGLREKTTTDLPANQSHRDFRYYVPDAFREHLKKPTNASR